MSCIIELKFNVGDKIKRVVQCGANMKHGRGTPKTEVLRIEEIKIISGSPINRNKKIVQYTCYNETNGNFYTLREDDIMQPQNNDDDSYYDILDDYPLIEASFRRI